MNFYLSSYQMGGFPEQLKRLLAQNLKHAALIINASDAYGDSKRIAYFKKYSAALGEIGVTVEEIDLRNYFSKSDSLKKKLSEFGLLWVTGGNTFVLRSAMAESGLDKILTEMAHSKNKSLVYGGFSAGVCVLSPTLKGIHLADEPEKIAEGYPNKTHWDGLNLIDFYIAPHFRSDHPESEAIEKVVTYYKAHDMHHFALSDGDVITIENEEITVFK